MMPPTSALGPSAALVAVEQLVAAIRTQAAPSSSTRFAIALPVGGAYFAIDADSHPVLLVPTAPGRAVMGRDFGGLSLSFGESLRFQVAGDSWNSAAVVLTCRDDDLVTTFCALALDVVSRVAAVAERPTPRVVSEAIGTWERLLRSRRRLSSEEELGLWGELWLLSQMQHLDSAVEAWRGPAKAPFDFLFGRTALECKASTQRLRHHVSQSQLGRSAGDASVFVVSLWVGPDPMGCSLPELVSRLDHTITDSAAFEAKLIDAGYSRADTALYRQRVSVREEPFVFPEDAVPRVRDVDPGVSGIRFNVVLDELRALENSAAQHVLRGPHRA